MDFNKLTLKSQEAVGAAQELARRMGNPEVYPEHLLLALLDQELPQQLVDSAPSLRAEAETTLRGKPAIQGSQQQPTVSRAFAEVLDRAFEEARQLQDEYVSTEHLLLALDVVPRDQLLAKLQHVRGALLEPHLAEAGDGVQPIGRLRAARLGLWPGRLALVGTAVARGQKFLDQSLLCP